MYSRNLDYLENVLLTNHRRNGRQLESTIRREGSIHKHIGLEASLKWQPGEQIFAIYLLKNDKSWIELLFDCECNSRGQSYKHPEARLKA